MAGVEIVEADCHCEDPRIIERAASILKRGGLVVVGTDTLYGLIADPFSREAVLKVYKVKKRPTDKPLPLLLGEAHHALLLVETSPLFWDLALRYWPGALTIIAPASPRAPEHLRVWRRIGVRLPDAPLVRAIARRLGGAVVGTSANKSGRTPPVTVYESISQLGEQVDLYIDCGPARIGEASTVVDVSEGRVTIYREGPVRIGPA